MLKRNFGVDDLPALLIAVNAASYLPGVSGLRSIRPLNGTRLSPVCPLRVSVTTVVVRVQRRVPRAPGLAWRQPRGPRASVRMTIVIVAGWSRRNENTVPRLVRAAAARPLMRRGGASDREHLVCLRKCEDRRPRRCHARAAGIPSRPAGIPCCAAGLPGPAAGLPGPVAGCCDRADELVGADRRRVGVRHAVAIGRPVARVRRACADQPASPALAMWKSCPGPTTGLTSNGSALWL